MRKPVYIIHPFKGKNGEYEANTAKIKAICRDIMKNYPHVVPVSPVLTLSFIDDSKPHEREQALAYCGDLLRAVAAAGGEAWIYGDYQNSEGCRKEIKLARELGIWLSYREAVRLA